MNKLILILFTLLIQFTNLPIPGRFTHLIAFSLFYWVYRVFIGSSKLGIGIYNKQIFLGISYIVILTTTIMSYALITGHDDISYFFTELIYTLSYVLILVTCLALFNNHSLRDLLSVFLKFHLISLIFAVFFGNGILLGLGGLLNNGDVVSYDRLAVFDSEPSYANVRFLTLLLTSLLYLFYTKNNFKRLYFILYAILTIIVIFMVRSKSTVGIILLSSSISFILIGAYNATLWKKLKYAFLSVSVFTLGAYVFMNSNYGEYVYSSLFGELSSGSLTSRWCFAISGFETFINYPLGLGKAFGYQFKPIFIENVYELQVVNEELTSMLRSGNLTLYSPKSGLISIMIWGGIPSLIFLLYAVKNSIKDAIVMESDLSVKYLILVLLLSLLFYLCVSDLSINVVIYLSFVGTVLSKLKKRSIKIV